jgi:ribonuclease VapC
LIVDTSALVAVIRKEHGHDLLEDTLEAAPTIAIGAPTLFEAAMVLTARLGESGRLALSLFVEENGIVSLPFDERHAHLAAQAFALYGKGRHSARLNYGDCMTYATAKVADAPLLFVGNDFASTDLTPALADL